MSTLAPTAARRAQEDAAAAASEGASEGAGQWNVDDPDERRNMLISLMVTLNSDDSASTRFAAALTPAAASEIR